LDLSPGSGVRVRSEAMLRAASARAGGQLRALDVSECEQLSCEVLFVVARENGASLTELRAWGSFSLSLGALRRLLAAAPLLRMLECDAYGYPRWGGFLSLLRNEPPFEAVSLRAITTARQRAAGQPDDAATLVEAVASHETLSQLRLRGVPLNGPPLDALVQLAISRPFSQCHLEYCRMTGESLSSLTRLLRDGSLEDFSCLSNYHMFTGQHVAAFCLALRSCKLNSLDLSATRFFDSLPDGLAVLDALIGHQTLQTLALSSNLPSEENKRTVGEALGRLVAADSALQSLNVSSCELGDDGLRPLFAAVAQSTRLLKLNCGYNYMISFEFARDVVLPAIRGNVSLMSLTIAEHYGRQDEVTRLVLEQAQALVAER
jgi:hypothetical protein